MKVSYEEYTLGVVLGHNDIVPSDIVYRQHWSFFSSWWVCGRPYGLPYLGKLVQTHPDGQY